jgi:hypothetical protein
MGPRPGDSSAPTTRPCMEIPTMGIGRTCWPNVGRFAAGSVRHCCDSHEASTPIRTGSGRPSSTSERTPTGRHRSAPMSVRRGPSDRVLATARPLPRSQPGVPDRTGSSTVLTPPASNHGRVAPVVRRSCSLTTRSERSLLAGCVLENGGTRVAIVASPRSEIDNGTASIPRRGDDELRSWRVAKRVITRRGGAPGDDDGNWGEESRVTDELRFAHPQTWVLT